MPQSRKANSVRSVYRGDSRARRGRYETVVRQEVGGLTHGAATPWTLSDKPEAKERFERESRAISPLNHANICQLHGIGSQDDISYLVMARRARRFAPGTRHLPRPRFETAHERSGPLG
jgi:serine/threonine protein kinase